MTTEHYALGATTNELHSIESEQALLGCVLIAPESFRALAAWMRADDFFLHKHRWLWEAFSALSAEGKAIDVITALNQLEAQKQLGEMGGMAYLTRLLTSVPNSLNAESYAVIVKDFSTRRALREAGAEIVRRAHDESKSVVEAVDEARAIVRGVEMRGAAANTLRPISEHHAAVFGMFNDPAALAARIVPTGFLPLDKLLGGGVERKSNTVIAARPGMGKTAWLVQAADSLASKGLRVAFFSKEMSADSILRRMACRSARVSWMAFRDEAASEADERRVYVELDRLHALGAEGYLLVDESSTQTTADVRRQCERAAEAHGGLDVVLADHLRLFADRDRNDNEVIRLGKMAWAFKQLAKDLGACTVVAVQLNNEVEKRSNKRPALADVRGSGEIVENADNVIGLYRPAYYATLEAADKGAAVAGMNDQTAEMWVLKQRDGLANTYAEMVFVAEHMGFEQVAHAPNAQVLAKSNGRRHG